MEELDCIGFGIAFGVYSAWTAHMSYMTDIKIARAVFTILSIISIIFAIGLIKMGLNIEKMRNA